MVVRANYRSGWQRLRGSFVLLAVCCLAMGVLLPALPAFAQSDQPLVAVGKIDGTITPIMARYVDSTIDKAVEDGATAVVFEMNTPGGLDSAMDDIVDDFQQSAIPVIVYITPDGASAESAGVSIANAAQIAAMAPGTTIGRSSSEDEPATITAEEALDAHAIDIIAPDLATLLTQIDGRTVQLASGTMTLATANARTTDVEMSLFERILQFLANPNVGYLFLSLGMLGLFFEMANPGGMLPGIVGAIAVIIGVVSLSSMPVNWAGAGLMALAFILFIADIFLPSAGLLTAGGIAAFVVGSFMLIDEDVPGYELSRIVVWTVAACLAAFFLAMGALALKTRFARSKVGREGLIGVIGVVRQTLAPSGMVFAQGELWSATLDETTGHHELEQGKSVVVIALDGLRLIVRPATETEQRTGASVAVPPWGRPEPA